MPDILLRTGQANPNDVVLRDPTLAEPRGASIVLAAYAPTVSASGGTLAGRLVATPRRRPTPRVANPVAVAPAAGRLRLVPYEPDVSTNDDELATFALLLEIAA
jgi:hypothetical protein